MSDKDIEQEINPLVLSLARVAHEVVGALATAHGDYTHKPWERLDDAGQKACTDKVAAYLATPGMTPNQAMGVNALVTMTERQRAGEYVFHGVVRAICREQSRP